MTSYTPLSELNKKEKGVFAAYLIWELCNLILIKYAQAACPFQIQCRIMYMAVCVNTLMTLYVSFRYRKEGRDRGLLLAVGLVLTCLADYYLTLHNIVLPGFILFCLVEAVYALYFRLSGRQVLIRAAFFALALALTAREGLLTVPHAFGVLNMTLIAGNVIAAWHLYKKEKKAGTLCLALGFTLFFGCDFSILVRTLSSGLLNKAANFMIWIFYAPSQVLLVLAYANTRIHQDKKH